MLEKIVAGLVRAKGPLKCPGCGEREGRIDDGGASLVVCGACGYRGSLSEWSMSSLGDGGPPQVDPDRAPAGTKISRRELGGGSVAWEVPPTGKSGGLLAFGILWTGFIAVFTVAFCGAALAGKVEGDMPPWGVGLFLLPFWVVGVLMLWFAIRFRYARHLLVVDVREVVLVRSMFKRSKRRALERGRMKSVAKREFYRQNKRPVYGIELRAESGKLRFGTTLSEEEKDWLVADIERTIWPEPEKVEQEEGADGGLRLHMPASRMFTVDLPPATGAGRWVGLLVGLVVVGAFIAVGVLAMDDAGFFRWIWLGFCSLFGLLMCGAVVNAIRNAGVTMRVSGDPGEIRVQRMKGPRMLSEKRMPREGVELRSFPSGRSNQTPMMRVELVGPGGTLAVVRWRAEDQVAPFVRELREHLG